MGMAAMKAMGAMKKKAVSKIAKGKMARAVVFNGTKAKTYTGLTKADLIKNKRGKIVSKKQSLRAKKNNFIKGWVTAVQKARKALGIKGLSQSRKDLLSTRRPRNSTSERIEHLKASAQGVGMSTPLERSRLGWCMCAALLMNDIRL